MQTRAPITAVSARLVAAVTAGLLVAVGAADTTRAAVEIKNPRVREAVGRGLKFLEAESPDRQLGALALQARALVSDDRRDHPRVAEALAMVRETIRQRRLDTASLNYSLGLAVAFVVELDHVKYRPEIEGLASMIRELQMPHGAWGYWGQSEGDTSMTQYAVYGLWMAASVGVETEDEVWVKAANWLLRTQDPGGGWGYHGRDPGTFDLVDQTAIRRSMTEAAMATLYLCGEHLNYWEFRTRDEDETSSLLHRTDAQAKQALAPRGGLDRRRLSLALQKGYEWDVVSREGLYSDFPYYHLYTIERFQSFRRAAIGVVGGAEPWYDEGVSELLRAQKPDGSWDGREGPVAATGFAVLFLLRSTRSTIHKMETLGGGMLIGGRGLPQPALPQAAQTSKAAPGGADPVDDLLRRLDDPRFLASIAQADQVRPEAGVPPPNELKRRLLELAQSDTPQAKAAALKALARTHDLSHVPVLIEGLSDPDPLVHQAAVDALRFISRRVADYGKPIPPEPTSRVAEARQWQQWFRSIRPSGR